MQTEQYYPDITLPENLTEEQKGMITLVQDTVQFYGADPKGRRSVKDDEGEVRCQYLAPNGNKCALARLFSDELVNQMHQRHEGSSASAVIKDLKLEVPYSKLFYGRLQSFHDDVLYWNIEGEDGGLTQDGKEYYIKLINNITEDYFPPK